MNKVIIITDHKTDLSKDSLRKETDLSRPGNRKWLMSHIIWATKFGYEVLVTPA